MPSSQKKTAIVNQARKDYGLNWVVAVRLVEQREELPRCLLHESRVSG
jgi:hypothetical protein